MYCHFMTESKQAQTPSTRKLLSYDIWYVQVSGDVSAGRPKKQRRGACAFVQTRGAKPPDVILHLLLLSIMFPLVHMSCRIEAHITFCIDRQGRSLAMVWRCWRTGRTWPWYTPGPGTHLPRQTSKHHGCCIYPAGSNPRIDHRS